VADPGDDRERVVEAVAAESVGAVSQAQRHVGDTTLEASLASGAAARTPAATASAPVRAVSAACRGISPRIPVPVARRTVAASGLQAAAHCARPTEAAYTPADAAAAPTVARLRAGGRNVAAHPSLGTVAATVAAAVATVASRPAAAEVPCTSPRLNPVTPAVWTATVNAGQAAERSRPPAPSRTSSPRAAAMTSGPVAVDLATRS